MLTYNINKAFNCNHPFSTVAQATGSTVTIKDTMASEEVILILHISTNAKVYGGAGGGGGYKEDVSGTRSEH